MIDKRYATTAQFHKVILRMMPTWASEMGEGRLIAGILAEAWSNGGSDPCVRFFTNETGMLERYCGVCGLDWEQVRELYQLHCDKRRKSLRK